MEKRRLLLRDSRTYARPSARIAATATSWMASPSEASSVQVWMDSASVDEAGMNSLGQAREFHASVKTAPSTLAPESMRWLRVDPSSVMSQPPASG